MEPTVPKCVFVTGGCGFIGSNFINHIACVWPGVKIINFDKIVEGSNESNVELAVRRSPRYHLVTGSLCNQQLMLKTLREHEVDAVVNFAANSSVDDCYRDPIGSVENNVLGMVHLLEACRHYDQLQRFIHISTDEVYGDSGAQPGEKPKREDSALMPTNTYSAGKAGCEALLDAYRFSYHLPAVILRMNNVYGPRQWPTKVVPRFILEAISGQPITIMGDGGYQRAFLYSEDACVGIRLILEQAKVGQVYNIGSDTELSIIELGKAIKLEVETQLGRPHSPMQTVPVPNRPYHDRRYYIDAEKIRNDFNWKCKVDFKEGLRRTVNWYLTPHPESLTERILVFGGHGWVGRQFCAVLNSQRITYWLARTRPGHHEDHEVEQELVDMAPTHVVSFIGRTSGSDIDTNKYLEGGPDKVDENARNNLYAPVAVAKLCEKLGIHMTYVGTGGIYQYDNAHPVDGVGFKEEDTPNYFGDSYSIMKAYTDRLMGHFSNVFIARIRLCVTFQAENRNLVTKVSSYQKIYDIPDSVTILPDMLPILLELIRQRYTGRLNMTNPGPVRHSQILAMYRELVDPNKNWDVIHDNTAEAERMCDSQAHCALDTSKLEAMYPGVRPALDGIHQAVMEITTQMGQLGKSKKHVDCSLACTRLDRNHNVPA